MVTVYDLWTVNGLAEFYGYHFYFLGIGKLMVYGIFMKQGEKADRQTLRAAGGSLSVFLGIRRDSGCFASATLL